MTETRAISVLIADDHPSFRLGVRVWLERFGIHVAGEIGSVASLIAFADQNTVDVLVLDVALIDGDGISALTTIRWRGAVPGVLVLTSHDDKFTARRAAEAGVAAFLPKDVEPIRIVETVVAIARGERTASPVQTTPELSGRESEVLALVAQGSSNREIADLLGISSETVKSYLQSAFAKLGVNDRTSAALLAREHKLIP